MKVLKKTKLSLSFGFHQICYSSNDLTSWPIWLPHFIPGLLLKVILYFFFLRNPTKPPVTLHSWNTKSSTPLESSLPVYICFLRHFSSSFLCPPLPSHLRLLENKSTCSASFLLPLGPFIVFLSLVLLYARFLARIRNKQRVKSDPTSQILSPCFMPLPPRRWLFLGCLCASVVGAAH